MHLKVDVLYDLLAILPFGIIILVSQERVDICRRALGRHLPRLVLHEHGVVAFTGDDDTVEFLRSRQLRHGRASCSNTNHTLGHLRLYICDFLSEWIQVRVQHLIIGSDSGRS